MFRKTLTVILCAVLAAGCAKKKDPAESEAKPAMDGAIPTFAPIDPETDSAASDTLTYRTETSGEVSFEISSQWKKDVSGNADIYYRVLDDKGNYEAFLLADATYVDYDRYGGKEQALADISKQSLPDGAVTVFANPIEVAGAGGYQTEFETSTEAGARICDMMIIAGPTKVTRMMFSQLKEGAVDYGTEFEEIWKTVQVEGSQADAFSSKPEPETNEGAVYEQSDYILNCYERNDGVTACDAMLEITNVGSEPIWLNDDVVFDIYNESGNVIASCTKGNIDLIPEVIQPGESGYYVTRKGIELPGGYSSGYAYELGGAVHPAEAEGTLHDYPLEIISVNDDNGRPSAIGYVSNDTNHDYPNIQLYIVYYDNDDRPVAAAHDYLGKLAPGSRQLISLGGKLTFESASISVVSNYIAYAREAYNPE
ncbi:MAG: hypothetical protein IKD68_07330 [Solobacterium sp.]|nr:hypothetical protein [Solobacterium sp.]